MNGNTWIELAKSINPLDKLAGAIKMLYEPVHAKRMADATAYQIQSISNAAAKSDIPVVYSLGGTTVDATNFEEFKNRTAHRLALQEFSKQQNIESVLERVKTKFEPDEKVTDEPLDIDWINHFFNSVAEVSKEEMQELWTTVLETEIRQPGSISFWTLATLKNMRHSEAQLFNSLVQYVFEFSDGEYGIFYDENVWKDYDLAFWKIMKMTECRLMFDNLLGNFRRRTSEEVTLFNTDDHICMVKPIDGIVPYYDGATFYKFTEVGKEIYQLSTKDFNVSFFFACARSLETKNDKIKVNVYQVQEIDGNDIKFNKEPLDINPVFSEDINDLQESPDIQSRT